MLRGPQFKSILYNSSTISIYSSSMLATDESYFFDQAPFRQPQKRFKKSADELPQSLRYAHLNPKLASFYKDNKDGEEDVTAEIEGKVVDSEISSSNTCGFLLFYLINTADGFIKIICVLLEPICISICIFEPLGRQLRTREILVNVRCPVGI